MFHKTRHRRSSEAKQAQLPVSYATHRRIAGAAIFGSAAIFISGNAIAPTLFNSWQRQSDSFNSFTPTDAASIHSLKAVGIEPETSAIQLEALSGDFEERSQ